MIFRLVCLVIKNKKAVQEISFYKYLSVRHIETIKSALPIDELQQDFAP